MNISDIKVAIPLSICDLFVSRWELDPETGLVRLIGPKSKDEEYQNYSEEEDRGAKVIAKVAARTLPVGKRPSKKKIDENEIKTEGSNSAKTSVESSEEEQDSGEEKNTEKNTPEKDSDRDSSSSTDSSTDFYYNQGPLGKMGNEPTKQRRGVSNLVPNKNNLITSDDYRYWKKHNSNTDSSVEKRPRKRKSDQNVSRQIYHGEYVEPPRTRARHVEPDDNSSSSGPEFEQPRRPHRRRNRASIKRVSIPSLDNSKKIESPAKNSPTRIDSDEGTVGEPVSFNKGFWKQ
jgi:hypothetical protein